MNAITQFRGPYSWLSNSYTTPVKFNGETYPSVEHAYQAAKSADPSYRARIRTLSASEARRAGKRLTPALLWNEIKLALMIDLLRQKFAQSELATRLLATGQTELIAGNWWHDTYWGVHMFYRDNGATSLLAPPYHGQNFLGKLLMLVRDELREAQQQ